MTDLFIMGGWVVSLHLECIISVFLFFFLPCLAQGIVKFYVYNRLVLLAWSY